MSHFRRAVLSGTSWEFISQVLRFAVGIVLARLIAPAEFGLLAMILSITGVAVLVSDLGLGSALVQRTDVDAALVRAAAVVSCVAGLLLLCLFVALSPLLARFYGEPRLVPLTMAMAATFAISGTTVAPQALMQRHMRFATLARIDVCAQLLAVGLAVALAMRGAGVWSLVAYELGFMAVRAGILCTIADVKWRGPVKPRLAWGLFGFGGPLLAANLLGYASRNADNILIGRYIGRGPLGFYTRAYQLMMLPVSRLTYVLGRIIFPTFARLQADLPKLRRAFVELAGMLGLVSIPLLGCMALHTRDIILTLYGPDWSGAIVPLQFLAIGGLLQPVSSTFGWLLTSQGRSDLLLLLSAIGTLLVITSFVIGLPHGIAGVSAAYAVACWVLLPITWLVSARVVHLRLTLVLRALSPAFIGLMGIVLMALVTRDLTMRFPPSMRLAIGAGSGLTVYAGIILLWRPPSFRRLTALVSEQLRGERPA